MGLVVGEKYVWFLVIFVKFVGFGGAKRWGDPLKSSFGVGMQATRVQFLWRRGFSLCSTAVLKLYIKSC